MEDGCGFQARHRRRRVRGAGRASQAFREVATKLKGHPGIFVSVTKGIEFETGDTMSRILRELVRRIASWRCPGQASHAKWRWEFRRLSCARARERRDGEDGAGTFSPAGISDLSQHGCHRCGIRRRVEERHRHRGGRGRRAGLRRQHEGGAGHAGVVGDAAAGRGVRRAGGNVRGLERLGDLMLTCFSKQSRNRDLGERLGRGESIDAIQASQPKLAEGYPTARSAYRLAREKKVATPVIDEVHAMLYEAKNPKLAVRGFDFAGRQGGGLIAVKVRRFLSKFWPIHLLTRVSAIKTLHCVKLCSAVRADALRGEGVKRFFRIFRIAKVRRAGARFYIQDRQSLRDAAF